MTTADVSLAHSPMSFKAASIGFVASATALILVMIAIGSLI